MIGETIASLTALGFTPNLVIMNAFDHFKIISARNSLGSYIAGGWSAASPLNLWGVPTVPTAALNAGTVIVLDTSVVRVLDREEANVQIGFQGRQLHSQRVHDARGAARQSRRARIHRASTWWKSGMTRRRGQRRWESAVGSMLGRAFFRRPISARAVSPRVRFALRCAEARPSPRACLLAICSAPIRPSR